MDKIIAGGIDESKPSFTVTTEAAALLTIGAGECAIYVGTGVKDINNQRAVSALEELEHVLREAQYPVGALAVNYAVGTPPSRAGYAAANAAAIPAQTEDEVVIAYGATFYDAGNSSNIGNLIRRLVEVYQEQVLKLN